MLQDVVCVCFCCEWFAFDHNVHPFAFSGFLDMVKTCWAGALGVGVLAKTTSADRIQRVAAGPKGI